MSNVLWQTRRYRTILVYYHYFIIIFIEGIKSIYSRASCTIAIATLISCMFHHFVILLIDRDKVLVTDKGKDQSMGTYLYMEDGNF